MEATSACVDHGFVVERPTCTGVGTVVCVVVVPGVVENVAVAAKALDKFRDTEEMSGGVVVIAVAVE